MEHKFTNDLIRSTSPYLLQHAHNPVNWQAWGDSIPEIAKRENKLILVSIGYAACHWCHVMEHESFEDEAVAKIMNEHFVCVKVDREERPDVDHYYMTAVQLMQQQGGWPLNVVALPDGRPIWGGTYFPKEMWVKNLLAVAEFYRKNTQETEAYAADLQNGIEQTSLTATIEDVPPVNKAIIEKAVAGWKQRFDWENGGRKGAPKFPMPNNLDFLLYYGYIENDDSVLGFVEITLEKMARGGIYDQIGGGFSRYSVDEKWKVPHFEKMLYDNGQLISVYSKAYQQFKNEAFKTVVYETFDFIERELRHESGAYYSSLDADSDGEEGKFYVWKSSELEQILKSDFNLFSNYYNINGKGFWEKGNNILLRDGSDANFAKKHELEITDLQQKIGNWKKVLYDQRAKRIRPGLDDKTLTSWNALVIQGLVDAYKAFQDEKFLVAAQRNAGFMLENLIAPDGKIFHTWKNGNASVDGFMEDYSLCIQAFLSLFEVSGVEVWLQLAKKLTDYAFQHFYHEESGLFYFSEKGRKSSLTNHFQNEDNVMPSANSLMAGNLHRMYLLFGKPEYLKKATKMLQHVSPLFPKYPTAYSNWGILMLKTTSPFFEIAISGKDARQMALEMQIDFHPNTLWAITTGDSEVPLLSNRFVSGKTLIYVCREGVCKLPVQTVEEGIAQIK